MDHAPSSSHTTRKPPASTPLLTETLFDPTMPPALFRSFARLYAMAWEHDYHHTDPLDFEYEIIPLLGISRTQAHEHLRLLRLAKLIDWTTNGNHQYTITFPSPENRIQESGKADLGSGKADSESGKPDSTPEKPDSESGKPDLSIEENEAAQRESGKADFGSGKPDSRRLEEDSLSLKRESSRLESGKPDSERILAATELLFGEAVLGPPARYPDPRLLLGAIAEAYHNRHKLRTPARVVYANLSQERHPASRYLREPAAYLPQAFLERAGLVDPPPEPEPEESPPEEPEPEPDPTLEQEIQAGVTAGRAWSMAVDQLQLRMAKDAFDTYLRGASLAAYDAERGCFTVAAPGAFARDWLQARLASTLLRLLGGICNRPVEILFITE